MKTKKEEHEHKHDENAMQGRMLEMNLLENKLRQMEQSLNFIDQQIMETQLLQLNLDEMKKLKKGQEMLFSLGKNVFVKGKIEEHDVMINIGNNIVVKKNEGNAKEVVERQKLQLVSVRDEITREMQKIIQHMTLIENSMQHEH